METCPSCKRNKSIILTESRIKTLLSEDLQFHIDNKIALSNITPLNPKLIKEARKLYSRGILQLNEMDTTLIKSNIGDKADYNGEPVALDMPIKGENNPEDVITMDVPLFIRMLEYAREDAKTDMDLHDVTEKAIALSSTGEILDMSKYEDIVGKKLNESYNIYHRNPSTKQVHKLTFNIYEQVFNIDRVRKLIKEALEGPSIQSIELVYTEQGGHFYNAYVKYSDGKEIKMDLSKLEDELKQSDIIVDFPVRYKPVELKQISEQLKDKGIAMSFNNDKDIS